MGAQAPKLLDAAIRIQPSATIAVTQKARDLKAAGRDVISLGAGEPDFDTPDNIKEAAIKAIRDGQTKYTAVDGIPELKKAIVDKFARENGLTYTAAQVHVASGGKPVIYNAFVATLNPGDEVIVPAYTYCASAIPFGDLGAHIVWADINKDTWTIDPDDFERKITPKTKAVVAVHLLGIPCDMKRIVAIARRHGIKVVEDCAQALDCRIDGQHVGTFGDFGCFSFHAAKTMTTLGEGGMFVCSDDQVAHNVPGIRHNGLCAFQGERERYWVPAKSNVDEFLEDRWPQNFCLGEAQCALGS